MRKFVLEIELENDAMRTPYDVARALRSITAEIATYDEFSNSLCLLIRDYPNGNKVGKCAVTEDFPDRQRESD